MVEGFSSLKGCIKGPPYTDTDIHTLEDIYPLEDLDLPVTRATYTNMSEVPECATKYFLNLFIHRSSLSPPSLTCHRTQMDKYGSK